jgi:hypothetical protein
MRRAVEAVEAVGAVTRSSQKNNLSSCSHRSHYEKSTSCYEKVVTANKVVVVRAVLMRRAVEAVGGSHVVERAE